MALFNSQADSIMLEIGSNAREICSPEQDSHASNQGNTKGIDPKASWGFRLPRFGAFTLMRWRLLLGEKGGRLGTARDSQLIHGIAEVIFHGLVT